MRSVCCIHSRNAAYCSTAKASVWRHHSICQEISEVAEKNGVSDMTLEEINAEINASRAERKYG